MKEGDKGGQNSSLRDIFSPIINVGAAKIIKKWPNITADKITNAGLLAVLGGSALKVIEKISGADSLVPLGLMVTGLIFDGLDGSISRLQKTSSMDGAIRDVIVDRTQESAMALSRIATASLRKDPWGVGAAAFAGITGSLPSLLRAKVEALDAVVPESGNNPLSIFGMRLPRAISAIMTTSFPEAPLFNYPIQPTFDTASSLGNIFAIIERASILNKAKKGELLKRLDLKTQELGKIKSERLSKFNILNTVIMVAAGTIGMINALKRLKK